MDIAAKTCFVLDLDGTVYLGDRPIPGAVRFIQRNLDSREFYFLSNNTSKNPDAYVRKLADMGIRVARERILSPVVPLARHLRARGQTRVYPVGNDDFRTHLRELLPEVRYGEEDCQAVLLAYDTSLTYAKLARSALLLQRPEVAFYATHPDLVCPSPEGPLPDVGSFLALYRTATGREPDRIFGKPDPDMLAPLLALHPRQAMVVAGDRLSTDKKLAEAAGIDFILVLSGEARQEDLPGLDPPPSLVLPDLGGLLQP